MRPVRLLANSRRKLSLAVEIGEPAVWALVGVEPVFAEDEDVAVDSGGVNILDPRDFVLTALESLEVGYWKDHIPEDTKSLLRIAFNY